MRLNGLKRLPMNDVQFFCLRGFMKSGTNWLGSLLSSHESISCVGEFHWQEVVRRIQVDQLVLPVISKEEYHEKARGHLEEMIRKCLIDAAEPGSTVIGDRTPHTIEPIALRGTKHISIVRDGRDVLVSRAFHLYNYPHVHRLFTRIPEMKQSLAEFQKDPWYFHQNPGQLLCHEVMVRESVRWWREHHDADQAFVDSNPDYPIRFVRYEDLHADTQRIRKELFQFLGVDPSRAAPIEGRLKPGFEKETPSAFLRKGAVGDWKNYFTDETKNWFKDEDGDWLVRHGYEQSRDW